MGGLSIDVKALGAQESLGHLPVFDVKLRDDFRNHRNCTLAASRLQDRARGLTNEEEQRAAVIRSAIIAALSDDSRGRQGQCVSAGNVEAEPWLAEFADSSLLAHTPHSSDRHQ